MDVIGFVFDYIFHDPSIPLRFRKIFDGLQVPILKAALLDPSIFTDKQNPARRLLDGLACAAIGAEDDEAYGAAFDKVASSIVAAIRDEYVHGRRCLRVCVRDAGDFCWRMAAEDVARDAAASGHWSGRGDARCRSFTRAGSHSRQAFRNRCALRHSGIRRNRLGGLPDPPATGRRNAQRRLCRTR